MNTKDNGSSRFPLMLILFTSTFLALAGCAGQGAVGEPTEKAGTAETVSPAASTPDLPAPGKASDTTAGVVTVSTPGAQPVKPAEGMPDAFASPGEVVLPATDVQPEMQPEVVEQPSVVEPHVWTITRQDRTLRETLIRWAPLAGYTFTAAHWTLPWDLPVTADDTIYGDFKTATRRAVGSSELTDWPVKPCFYPNHVLRVIAINESCKRTTARR